MSNKKSEKDPEVTPELKDSVFFSIPKDKKFKVCKNKTKKYVVTQELDKPSPRRQFNIPDTYTTSIIFNSTQQYKEDCYGTYKELELRAAVYRLKNDLQSVLNVVPTIDTRDRSLNMFNEYCSMIIDTINNSRGRFCKNIGRIFIEDNLPQANAILILYDGIDKILGFASLYFLLDHNSLYIDLICSDQLYKGGGKILMSKIKEIGKIMEVDTITLSSLTEALGFYVNKEGFECNDTCNLAYNMFKDAAPSVKKKTPSKKTSKKQSKKNL